MYAVTWVVAGVCVLIASAGFAAEIMFAYGPREVEGLVAVLALSSAGAVAPTRELSADCSVLAGLGRFVPR